MMTKLSKSTETKSTASMYHMVTSRKLKGHFSKRDVSALVLPLARVSKCETTQGIPLSLVRGNYSRHTKGMVLSAQHGLRAKHPHTNLWYKIRSFDEVRPDNEDGYAEDNVVCGQSVFNLLIPHGFTDRRRHEKTYMSINESGTMLMVLFAGHIFIYDVCPLYDIDLYQTHRKCAAPFFGVDHCDDMDPAWPPFLDCPIKNPIEVFDARFVFNDTTIALSYGHMRAEKSDDMDIYMVLINVDSWETRTMHVMHVVIREGRKVEYNVLENNRSLTCVFQTYTPGDPCILARIDACE